MSKDHAKLSASGSSKWLNCPGSIKAESIYPNSQSEYAEEGTLAHELADLCLKNKQDTIEYIDRTISCESNGKTISIIVSEEMAKFVQEYLDYVRSFETIDTQLFTEDRVDFSNVVPEGFGTMDAGILDYKKRKMHIFDLKYGMIEVLAENNTQGLLYCVGILNELEWMEAIDSFTIHIVQPRKFNYSSWEISIEDLKKFMEEAKIKAEEALKENPKRIPGEKQCMFCKANGDCPALEKLTFDTVENYFENIEDEEKIDKIPEEKLKKILDNKSLIEKFLKQVEANVLNRLKEGKSFKGYKLVQGKSNRKWIDEAEEKLNELLGEKAYEKSLIGITAAEKLLKKDVVNELTYKPDGQLLIANEDDPRPAVKPILDEFEDLTEEL